MQFLRPPVFYIISFLILVFCGSALAQEPISLDTGGKPLREVLQQVTQASGIHFRVSEKLAEMKINKRVEAQNWKEVVQQLLDNYNRLDLSGSDGNLKKVFVLSLKNSDHMARITKQNIPATKKLPLETSEIGLNTQPIHDLAKDTLRNPSTRQKNSGKKKRPLEASEIWLNTEQLQELAKGPFRDPLPNYFYHDPGLNEFLALHEISSPDQMDNIQKAIRVRVEARRQLKILHKDKLKNKD
jgi:hypothetical protein